jgi:hypothetical protein
LIGVEKAKPGRVITRPYRVLVDRATSPGSHCLVPIASARRKCPAELT